MIFTNKNLEIFNHYCFFQCVKQQINKRLIIKQIGIKVCNNNSQTHIKIKKRGRKQNFIGRPKI